MRKSMRMLAIGAAVVAGPLLATAASTIGGYINAEDTAPEDDFSLDRVFVDPGSDDRLAPTSQQCQWYQSGCTVTGTGGSWSWFWGWGDTGGGHDTSQYRDGDDGGGSEPPASCDTLDQVAGNFATAVKNTYPLDTVGPVDVNSFSPTLQNANWLHAAFIGFHTAQGQVGPTIVTHGGYQPDFSQFPGPVEGFSHNHPQWLFRNGVYEQMSAALRNENRYPSQGDWNVLQAIADHYGPSTGNRNPSLYLTDAWGVTREFKLSDRAYFQGLGYQRVQDGYGLNDLAVDVGGCSR